MTDVQFRMREFRLANGLRSIVEEDHAAPLVGVVTVVNVGSSGDPKGKERLAHLVEHLASRAKPNGGGTAWSQLEAAGVGCLTNPLLGVDQATVDVEREVLRNELRQRGENAIGPAFNFLQEAAFPPGHGYARPIGGPTRACPPSPRRTRRPSSPRTTSRRS
jgi:zinc protease